jgi:hypothetical protein
MSFYINFKKGFIFIFLSLTFSIFVSGTQNYSPQEVEKVLKALEKIERETASGKLQSIQKISVSESEFNSYISYRIEEQNEKFLKELRIKLFKKNKIEGMVLIDLRGEKVPKFLRPQMTLYFRGKLEVKNGLVRLGLKDLFLEEQRIEPKVLDLVIAFAAKIENFEVWSINDWYELPYGIKNIETQNHKAVVFY